jgi:hypothetical protein
MAMPRVSVFFALTLSSFFAISQLAIGAPASPDSFHARVELQLKASNGLSARLENDAGEISLTISGHRQHAQYIVHGKVSPSGVEARFGKLGEVSVGFRPTRTIDSLKPAPGCEGDPWTTKAGFFSGTIHFRGERDYMEIHAGRTKGRMEVTPEWKCRDRTAAGPDANLRGRDRAFGEVEEEGDVATLAARQPRFGGFFATYAVRDPQEGNFTFFAGGAIERHEGMRIVRTAIAAGRASTFTFDHEHGRAAVSPPWPFRGSARFRQAEHGPDSWRGSLRVPLLGAGVQALTGAGFDALLKRDFPSD